MMEVQAGPSAHHYHPFQSASGTGAPTFRTSDGDYYAGGSTTNASTAGAQQFHALSQANPSSYPGFAPTPMMTPQMPANNALLDGGIPYRSRKRKADSQTNERLSKRLSLLNLEHNGNKLYVPVESPQLIPTTTTTTATPTNTLNRLPESDIKDYANSSSSGEGMQLDDTKHKVYIYNLDDELSSSGSSSDGESSADEGGGRLVFLPDIHKHLLQNRIPPSVLANPEGQLAGVDMQMVLYREPASLSVPEAQDSVRRAVIEARHRLREQQKGGREEAASGSGSGSGSGSPGSSSTSGGSLSVSSALSSSTGPSYIDEMSDDTPPPPALHNGYAGFGGNSEDHDPDAMEMD